MHKLKLPKLNDYVLVSRWSDHDPKDPWHISHIIDIWEGYNDETSSSRESFKQIITSKIKNKLHIKVMNNDILLGLKGKEIYLEKLEYMSDNTSNN